MFFVFRFINSDSQDAMCLPFIVPYLYGFSVCVSNLLPLLLRFAFT